MWRRLKKKTFSSFFQGFNELSGSNEPQKIRRLCIHPKMTKHFKKSRLFCPQLHSLLFYKNDGSWQKDYFNPLYFIGTSKLVWVLDLSGIFLGFSFPDEIEMLVQLRYLAIRLACRSIPSSIANLSNLETFFVHVDEIIKLPNSIWNLKKLRHLEIKCKSEGWFCLDTANIDNSPEVLCNLDTFSTVALCWEDLEKAMKKFPNIRTLKVSLRGLPKTKTGLTGASTVESNKVRVLEFLSRLESLNVFPSDYWTTKSQIELSFSSNLRKLTLSGFGWQWCKISEIENLPNLEVLKLSDGAFVGEVWNMGEAGKFPKLGFLGLYFLDIVRWTASESVQDHFPRLVKLELDCCYKLEEIPACLGDIANLQMIVVSYCRNSVVTSIKQIEEEQKSMGNEDLKVVINSFIPLSGSS